MSPDVLEMSTVIIQTLASTVQESQRLTFEQFQMLNSLLKQQELTEEDHLAIDDLTIAMKEGRITILPPR